MSSKHVVAGCWLLLALSSVASAQDLSRARRVACKVRTQPLALQPTARGVGPFAGAALPVADLVLDLEAGRSVTAFVVDRRAVALEGRTLADTVLLDDPGLGGTSLASLSLHTPVAVFERRSVSGPTGRQPWLRVALKGGQRGWLLAEQVRVGTDSPVGDAIGGLLAPGFGLGSKLRGARFFHPDGHVYEATVTSLHPGAFAATAARLEGAALIRLGLGMHRLTDPNAEPWFDALSLAIRFTDPRHGVTTRVHEGDQDLLVTAWAERFHQFFWRVPFVGETKDFLANDYFPAMPFRVEGQDVWLRVVPSDRGYTSRGAGRIERLDNAIADGQARFTLAVQRDGEEAWTPLVELRFARRVDVDQDALHYHPGLAGRGLQPTGWVAAARGAVYRASQDARPQPARARGAAAALEEAAGP